MITFERRKKEVPIIRYYGDAAQRTKKQVIQSALLCVGCVAMVLVLLQAKSAVRTLQEFNADATKALSVVSPKESSRAQRDNDREAVNSHRRLDLPSKEATVADERSSLAEKSTCITDRADVLDEISAATAARPDVTIPADSTKRHLDSLFALLKDSEYTQCLASQRRSVAKAKSSGEVRSFFFDLGSRAMDQTRVFLQKFPNAARFNIVAYEANPKFNGVYSEYSAKHPQTRLTYRNAAVGVENTTLTLSDHTIGGSIVREGANGATVGGVAAGATTVQVVDFAREFTTILQQSDLADANSFVVMKMDIEKMEFAVLHRMLTTKSILLVDELLLECHYNTNKAKAERDATKHIGMDDCVELIELLNRALGSGSTGSDGGAVFEAVLWNSVKTAKKSGYGPRHGGFFPS